MTNLFIDLIGMHLAGETRSPAEIVKSLGISYERWEGQPMADQITLHGCTNIPGHLPAYMSRG